MRSDALRGGISSHHLYCALLYCFVVYSVAQVCTTAVLCLIIVVFPSNPDVNSPCQPGFIIVTKHSHTHTHRADREDLVVKCV